MRLRFRPHLDPLILALAAWLSSFDLASDLELLAKHSAPIDQRIQAAKTLSATKDMKEAERVLAEFTTLALKSSTPEPLRRAMADGAGGMDAQLLIKVVGGKLGACKGPGEKWYALRALRAAPDAALDKTIQQKFLRDEDPSVRRLAIETLVEHKATSAIADLVAIVRSGKDEEVVDAALMGVTKLQQGTPGWPDWERELAQLAASPSDAVRRGALATLAKGPTLPHIAVFSEALKSADWSSRLIALQALEKSGSKEAIAKMIDALRIESTDSRLQAELVRKLERLTQMSWGRRIEDWDKWWKNNQATFEMPRLSGPATKSAKRDDGGTHVEAPKFYGIEIESKRVIFVIDISGSMQDPTQSPEYEGKSRFEVATTELLRMIDGLPPASLFNIVLFNTGVDAWLDDLAEAAGEVEAPAAAKARKGPRTGPPEPGAAPKPVDEDARKRDADKQAKLDTALRAKARKFVEAMDASGGTNIHDALELAFEDPLVDTIFLLTDGQPSAGKELSDVGIRSAVQRWNATRRIKVNTISIGTEFPLLRWLASDSGGECKFVK